jgi:hypothetical protein
LIVGVACFLDAGVPGRFGAELQPYFAFNRTYDFSTDARAGSCWLGKDDAADGFATACVDPPGAGKQLVLLWGDSHAARFYPGLKAMDGGRDRLAQFTRDACPPILDEHKRDWCDASNRFVLTQIQALKPDVVVLFSRWSHHFTASPKDTKVNKLLATIATLRSAGIKQILVMGPAPNWQNSLPQDLVRNAIHRHAYTVSTRTKAQLVPGIHSVDVMLTRRLADLPGVTYFSTYDALCDASGCLTTTDGQADGLTTFDYGHLTTTGAIYVAHALEKATGYPDLRGPAAAGDTVHTTKPPSTK